MGIFEKFRNIINSNVNAALDKAEDPEKTLNYLISEMEDALVQMKSSIAERIVKTRKLSEKLDDAEVSLSKWQKRAELAVGKGDDDLAREALREKNLVEKDRDRLDTIVRDSEAKIAEGKKDILTLQRKLDSAKSRLSMLRLEKCSSSCSCKYQEKLNRLTQKFEELEVKLDVPVAYKKLNDEINTNSTEAKFAKIESDDRIEAQLAEIKSKLNKN